MMTKKRKQTANVFANITQQQAKYLIVAVVLSTSALVVASIAVMIVTIFR